MPSVAGQWVSLINQGFLAKQPRPWMAATTKEIIMKTVLELKKELDKFEDTDLCYAYEGEVIGIIVNRNNNNYQGVIYCGEGTDTKETELIRPLEEIL